MADMHDDTSKNPVSARDPQKTETSQEDTPSASARNLFGESLSASLGGNIRRTESGHVDVLHAIGGWRGLAETSLPALFFLTVFTITQELNLALVVALVTAGIFTVVRLAQRSKLIPAVSGVVGVAVCAVTAYTTGDAANYYVPGFWTNGLYSAAFLISIVMRWPLAGLIFGYIRGENLTWREKPQRIRAYSLATWIMITVLLVRLIVQVPLYFMNATELLGVTRIIMGLPLYAAGIWLAWRVSDPRETA